MKHVVIVGGGFGGVRLARRLKKEHDLTVTIINRSPDFRYCPAMYRAATGSKIGVARLPLEWMILDLPHASLTVDRAMFIDPDNKVIITETGRKIPYDIAVLSMGSITTYFNIEGLHEHAFGIKTPREVTELRQHLHDRLANHRDVSENYVIVGAGATGVELAGGFGSYIKKIAKKHKIRRHNVRIWVVEAAPRILPQLSERAARKAQKRLEKLGVNILVNTAVTKETLHSLKTSNGSIKTDTVVWTAGTTTNHFYERNKKYFDTSNRGKVKVNSHLEALPNVYVIGDNALTRYSGLALTAVWHANFVARDIRARLHHKKRPKWHDTKPVSVIPSGRMWGVLTYGNFVFTGRLVSFIRIVADFIGYSDVLGPLKALTIWSNSDKSDDSCDICNKA